MPNYMSTDQLEQTKQAVTALLRQGKSGEAIAIMNELTDQYPDSPDVHEYFGDLLYECGFLKETADYYTKAIQLNGTGNGLPWKRAEVLALMRRWPELAQQGPESGEPFPDSWRKILFEAKWANRKGLYQQSLALLEAGDIERYDQVEYIYWKAEALYLLYRADEWLAFVSKHALVETTNPWYNALLAEWNEQSGYAIVGEERANKLVGAFPYFPPAILAKAVFCWKRNAIDAARQWFEYGIKHAAWWDEMVGMYLVFTAENFPGQINWPDWEKMAESPAMAKLPYYLGKIELGIRRNPEEALLWLGKTVRLLPEFLDARRLMAQAMLQNGAYRQAIQAFEELLAINDKIAEAWAGIGFANLQLGNDEEAIIQYEKSVTIDPKQPNHWHALSEIALKRNDLDAALLHIGKAQKLNKTEHRFMYAAARIHEALGDKGKALEQINKALQKMPDDTDYLAFKARLNET